MTALLTSFMFVLLAEMGDKTQLLAMAFASKYKAWQVLTAVFIATLVANGLAVAAGQLLSSVLPMTLIAFIASLSFIGFGLWTIRGEELEGEDKKASKFGPIMTVAIAFFIAELGDKTQLATVSLAAKYASPLAVLLGTTAGMVVADAIGILIGVILHKHIPEKTTKWVAAIAFMVFGVAGIYTSMIKQAGAVNTLIVLSAVIAFTVYFSLKLSKTPKQEG